MDGSEPPMVFGCLIAPFRFKIRESAVNASSQASGPDSSDHLALAHGLHSSIRKVGRGSGMANSSCDFVVSCFTGRSLVFHTASIGL